MKSELLSKKEKSVINLSETSGPSPTNEQLSDASAYVKFWSLSRKLEFDGHRRLLLNLKTKDETLVLATLFLDYKRDLQLFSENKNNNKVRSLSKEELDFALLLRIHELREKLKKDALYLINHPPEIDDLGELKRLVVAITGEMNEFILFLIALWLQQVKRKLNDLPPKRHIFLTLYASQGSGKTELIEKLLSPLKGLYSNFSVNQLMDERLGKSLQENYILFLDELMGVEKADMSTLKKLITQKVTAHRPLYGKSATNIDNNASFIAASNKPLFENFKDRTGLRRFAEIKALNKMNWEEINNIDFVEIWKSIDIKEDYYAKIKDRLEVQQKEGIATDSIDSFIDDFEISNEGVLQDVPTENINIAYQKWAKENGYRVSANRNDLTASLIDRCNLEKTRPRISGHKKSCLRLSCSRSLMSANDYVEKIISNKKDE